jgi:2,3-bisphosphoglycerate-dependent phosphoglycerate mutase
VSATFGNVGSELVLVRHGEGECNAAGVIGGPRGCRGLSARGRAESVLLAERLAELHARRPVDVVLSSPRRRVLECAQIIGQRLDREVILVPGLRGQEFGDADGRPWRQVVDTFGGPPTHDPHRPIARGAESWNAYADRVLRALRDLLRAYDGKHVLLVAHGRTTGLAGALLSGAADPRASAQAFVVDHGALSTWRRDPGGWRLDVANDSAHLRAGLVGPTG